jgi:short subunit dehydrogenase-like uncharacterized protein
VLPKPGEGPSEKEMDKGFLTVTGFGTGTNGHKVRAEMHFSTDAGYRDTVTDSPLYIQSSPYFHPLYLGINTQPYSNHFI